VSLEDIAAGVTVTHEQRDRARGVPEVDETGEDLTARLEPHADALPCTAAAAATVVETYGPGTGVGDAARAAGVAPMTAAKVLYRCGVAGVCPLAPTAREVVRDWLDGRLSRTEAETLAGADEAAFALGAYVETHEAVPELAAAVEGVLAPETDATAVTRDALDGADAAASDWR
jgi:hypothetical protein